MVTTTFEHPAVLAAAAQLDHTLVPVDGRGMVDPDASQGAPCGPNTKVISVMHANNEVGTIQPISEIARIAAEAGVALHSDGVQAVGKIPVNVAEPGRRDVFHQRAQDRRAQGRGGVVRPQGNRAQADDVRRPP